jgi:hypothetical protein
MPTLAIFVNSPCLAPAFFLSVESGGFFTSGFVSVFQSTSAPDSDNNNIPTTTFFFGEVIYA